MEVSAYPPGGIFENVVVMEGQKVITMLFQKCVEVVLTSSP